MSGQIPTIVIWMRKSPFLAEKNQAMRGVCLCHGELENFKNSPSIKGFPGYLIFKKSGILPWQKDMKTATKLTKNNVKNVSESTKNNNNLLDLTCEKE